MTRFTHIILLLLSLMIIVRVGLSGFSGPADKSVAEEQQDKDAIEVPGKMVFNPETSSPPPDLNEGYLFAEGRLLVESDYDEFSKDGKKDPETTTAVDLEEVVYSGSIIIGELRKALVAYPSVQRKVERGGRRGAPKGRAAATMLNEQLEQGGIFMGFLVASIEKDRIVFEKGDERVEKFLHDQNKERIIVKGKATQPVRPPAAANAAAAAASAGSAPPADPTQAPPRTSPNPAAATTPPLRKPQPPPDLLQRRSQRLLKLDPSFMMPGGGVTHTSADL